MKRYLALLLSMILLILCSGCPGSGSSFNAKAKITIKVVDENNDPLKGIDVGIAFPRIFYGKEKNEIEHKLTDMNGRCSASGASYDTVRYVVIREGYYHIIGSYKFKQKNFGSWAPNNPEVTIVLRKVKSPVPMYSRRFYKVLPLRNTDIGCDLIANDWVKPYGDGIHSDITFHLKKQYNNEFDYRADLQVKFFGRDDGFVKYNMNMYNGSEFKLPRYAPTDGYQKQFIRQVIRPPGKPLQDDQNENNGYVFRIRSFSQNSIMYGKIQGDIELGANGAGTAGVAFSYYLNPDHTRNLEFDPKKNLFTDLKSFERPGL